MTAINYRQLRVLRCTFRNHKFAFQALIAYNKPRKQNFPNHKRRGVITGETVYAVGSSKGLTGTLSDGLVSTASRIVDDVDCIQITAAISSGNSGGPLINIYGEVIGSNTMSLASGQNLNFAVNITELQAVETTNAMTMAEFYDETVFLTILP